MPAGKKSEWKLVKPDDDKIECDECGESGFEEMWFLFIRETADDRYQWLPSRMVCKPCWSKSRVKRAL